MTNPAALFSWQAQTQPRDFHDKQGASIAVTSSGSQDELLLQLKDGICGGGFYHQSFGSHHTQYHHNHHHHQSNAAELSDQPLMSYFSAPSLGEGNAKNQGVREGEGSRGIKASVEEDEEEGLGNVVNVRYPYDWEQVSQVLFEGTPDFFLS